MRRVGARHGHAVVHVFQAIVGFVVDGWEGFLLLHAAGHTAALDHEAGNDAVKNRVVVMPVLQILQKIGDGVGRFFSVQLQGDGAHMGDMQFDLGIAHGDVSTVAVVMVMGVAGTFWKPFWLRVATLRIASMVSIPLTTLPNTA